MCDGIQVSSDSSRLMAVSGVAAEVLHERAAPLWTVQTNPLWMVQTNPLWTVRTTPLLPDAASSCCGGSRPPRALSGAGGRPSSPAPRARPSPVTRKLGVGEVEIERE